MVSLNALLIVAGTLVSCAGEFLFVPSGVLFQSTAVACQASQLVLVEKLFRKHKLDPLLALYYLAPVCACFSAVSFCIFELSTFSADALTSTGVYYLVVDVLMSASSQLSALYIVRALLRFG